MADHRAALSSVPADRWASSTDHESGETARWLPLVQITDSRSWLGLADDGGWVVGRPGGLIDRSSAASPGWLALLDHDPAIFLEELRYSADKYRLPAAKLEEALPIEGVLLLGLSSRSESHFDRVVEWVSAVRPTPQVATALREAVEHGTGSQRARQHAKRILARIG